MVSNKTNKTSIKEKTTDEVVSEEKIQDVKKEDIKVSSSETPEKTAITQPGESRVTYPDPKASSLVVDDRFLPDSGLPTETVEGVLDIA